MKKFIIVQSKELIIPCDYIQTVVRYYYADKVMLGAVMNNQYLENSYYTLSLSKCTNSDRYTDSFVLNLGEFVHKNTDKLWQDLCNFTGIKESGIFEIPTDIETKGQ